MVSKKSWDKLTPEQQEALRAASLKWHKKLVQKVRKDNKKSLKVLKKQGIELVKVSDEQSSAWDALAIRVQDKLAGKVYSKKILETVRNPSRPTETANSLQRTPMEAEQTSGHLPVPESGALRMLHRFYTHLDRLEASVVGLLLAAVLVLSLIEILGRNLGWHPWDMGANQRAVFGFTFYLGLYGAVLASRQGKHISIDVASPYLAPKAKLRIGIFLTLVAAVACGSGHFNLYFYHGSDSTGPIPRPQSDSRRHQPPVVFRIVEGPYLEMADGACFWVDECAFCRRCF